LFNKLSICKINQSLNNKLSKRIQLVCPDLLKQCGYCTGKYQQLANDNYKINNITLLVFQVLIGLLNIIIGQILFPVPGAGFCYS
jgi:hypothetical protein